MSLKGGNRDIWLYRGYIGLEVSQQLGSLFGVPIYNTDCSILWSVLGHPASEPTIHAYTRNPKPLHLHHRFCSVARIQSVSVTKTVLVAQRLSTLQNDLGLRA